MTADWTLRYYREGDEQGILDCLTAAFGRWPAIDIDVPPIEHLRWKLSSDSQARGFHYVAQANGRTVGTTVAVVRPLKLGDDAVRMVNYTDFSFHPEFQGRGRMKSFWAYAERSADQTFQVVAGFSANEAIRANMAAIGRLPPANAIELHERPLSSTPPLSCEFPVRTSARFDERVNDLWRASAPAYAFCVGRTADYLNWRYADPRAGRYSIRFVEHAGKLLGFAVLGGMRERGVIADLFALPDRPDVLGSLVDDAVASLEQQGRILARCWSPRNHVLASVLEQRRFRRARAIAGLGFTPYGSTSLHAVYEDDHLPVYFAMGDTDVV